MKNKIAKLILLSTLSALLLTGCTKPDLSKLPLIGDKLGGSSEETEVTGEEEVGETLTADVSIGEQPVGVTLTNDDAKTVIQQYNGSEPTILKYSDNGALSDEITVQSGEHIVKVIYQIDGDENSYEINLGYIGIGDEVEEPIDETDEEEIGDETAESETEEDVPTTIENLKEEDIIIKPINCDIIKDFKIDDVIAGVEDGSYDYDVPYVTATKTDNPTGLKKPESNYSTAFSKMFNEINCSGNILPYDNGYQVNVEGFYDDENKVLYFAVSSSDVEDVHIMFAVIPSDDTIKAIEDEIENSEFMDTSMGLSEMISDGFIQLYSDIEIEEETNPESEEQEVASTTDETIDTYPADSYRGKYPDLFKYPASTNIFSRWDRRITDSTSFTSTITMADGTIIPQEQQNQDGYMYNFTGNNTVGGSTSGTSTGDGSGTSTGSTENDEDYITLTGSNSTLKVVPYSGKNYTISPSESTSTVAIVKKFTSKYFIKYCNQQDFSILMKTNYYTNEKNIGDDYSIYEEKTSATVGGTTIHNIVIEYRDSTGAKQTRPYMSYINIGDDYYVCMTDDGIEYEFSTTLEEIIKYCIEE